MKAETSTDFWSTLREALHGSTADLTAIPVPRAVTLLAIPMVLEMSTESLFAVIDMFFVGRLGESAVATVGLTESLMSLVYAVAMGLSVAATASVSRRIGEKDSEGAASAAGQVLVVAVASSIAIGAVGFGLSSHLLALMGASSSVVASGSRYTAILLGGSVSVFLLMVLNAIFRSAGDAAVAMRSLALAMAINIVLAPCFIFGLGPFPKMGVAGAAVATTVSRGLGVVYQLTRLSRGLGHLRLSLRHLRPRFGGGQSTHEENPAGSTGIRVIVTIATAASLQILVETASWIGLVRILSVFGSTALAGYTIAMRVVIFALLPPWGLANAAATLVGQNLGAGAPERAEASVRKVARYNVVFLGAVGLVFLVLAPKIVAIFTTSPEVASLASECLRIVALGFASFAYGMVMIQSFNGAGDSVTPMLVNLGAFWLFKLPLAYVLAQVLGYGPRGVFIAITAAYAMQAAAATILFRRGRWKKTSLAVTTGPTP